MNTRPAWGLLFFGALIVAALLVSPIWLNQLSPYIEEDAEEAPFPPEFYVLSIDEQDLYMEMFDGGNQQMAIDFVAERIATAEPIEEPNLPALDPAPEQVQRLLTASFVSINPIRGATGLATLYRLSDGRRLLRIEDLEAFGGPDLHVLLSAYPDPISQEELDQVSSLEIDLGPLKSTSGSMNYLIEDPAFNVDNYQSGSVVLYSTRYEIIFSHASFAPVG